MRKSRFQKQHKQKKSPQRPQCHKWHCHRCGHFFLYACTKNGQNRSYSHYFIHIQVAENATSTGHAKRGSVLVTIFGYNAPCRKTSLPSIADKATADNPVLRQCTTGGTPVTASHARMTMTVTGLPHGGRKANFPLSCSTALNPSTWRCTSIPLFPFPFRLSMRMPLFPCRYPGRHQVSFSLHGAKVKTGLGTQIFCRKISTPFQG